MRRLLAAALLVLAVGWAGFSDPAHSAHQDGNLICQETSTTGTGTVNLGSACTGWLGFLAGGITSGNTVTYTIVTQDETELETGVGTFTDATPDTLSRTAITSTDGAGNELDLPAGTHRVYLQWNTQSYQGGLNHFDIESLDVDASIVAGVNITATTGDLVSGDDVLVGDDVHLEGATSFITTDDTDLGFTLDVDGTPFTALTLRGSTDGSLISGKLTVGDSGLFASAQYDDTYGAFIYLTNAEPTMEDGGVLAIYKFAGNDDAGNFVEPSAIFSTLTDSGTGSIDSSIGFEITVANSVVTAMTLDGAGLTLVGTLDASNDVDAADDVIVGDDLSLTSDGALINIGAANDCVITHSTNTLTLTGCTAVGFGGGSGATTALDNLASVAINTTLVSDTDNTDDLGTSSIGWRDLYLTSDVEFDGGTASTLNCASANCTIEGQGLHRVGGNQLNSETEDTAPDMDSDFVLTYDASATTHKKVLIDNVSAMVRLGGGAISGASSVDFAYDGFTTRYLAYMVVLRWNGSASNAAWIRFSDDGGATFEADAADYSYAANEADDDAVAAQLGSPGAAQILMTVEPADGGDDTGGMHCVIWIYPGFASTQEPAGANWKCEYMDDDATPEFNHVSGAGRIEANATYTDFRFLPSTGTIEEGDYVVYGLRGN